MTWEMIQAELERAGVQRIPPAIESAQRSGCAPLHCLAQIAQWRLLAPVARWKDPAAVLCDRIKNLSPGQAAEANWPGVKTASDPGKMRTRQLELQFGKQLNTAAERSPERVIGIISLIPSRCQGRKFFEELSQSATLVELVNDSRIRPDLLRAWARDQNDGEAA